MVSINQIEAGAVKYIDNELAPKIPTNIPHGQIKKIAAIAGATYAIRNGLRKAAANPTMSAIGAVDESGNIDLEGLASSVKDQIPDTGLKVTAPILGELTFFREDIDRLLQYITGGQ